MKQDRIDSGVELVITELEEMKKAYAQLYRIGKDIAHYSAYVIVEVLLKSITPPRKRDK